MDFILYIIVVPFLYISYKIIVSDIKYKIIPNKYLLYLLCIIPFYYIYLFFSIPEISYLVLLWQVLLTFIISFILYSFGIWSAGDAKYLLVLSLFIPNIGVIPFIGNIALLILVYLFLYFLYFYFGKCVFDFSYSKDLWKSIKNDLDKKWEVHKSNKGGNTFFIVLKRVVVFLIIFVSLRLSRIYLFNNIFDNQNSIILIKEFTLKYNVYLILIFILIFILGIYLFNLLINKLKRFISNNLKLSIGLIGNIFTLVIFTILIAFIISEYLINPEHISRILFLIFTLYISIYVAFKILVYGYKITFGLNETSYIDIKDLKKSDMVDMTWFLNITKYKKDIINRLGIYDFNFKSIKNIIRVSNKNVIKNKKNEDLIRKVKIVKTFAFSPYIFLGFIFTYFIGDLMFKIIVSNITVLINKLWG